MTDENTNVSTETETVKSPPKPAPSASPKVALARGNEVREAEHKLKEMSRKAKERQRGTAHNASKTRTFSEVNYFWLVIGGLGALGVGYLVFGGKEEAPKPRQRFKFVPKPKTPEGPALTPKAKRTPVKEEIKKEESVAVPKFELNCF